MRRRTYNCATLISALLICVASTGASAQSRPNSTQHQPIWESAVGFTDGTVVKLGVGVFPAGSLDLSALHRGSVVGSAAANAADYRAFIRILRLADGRVVVYEVRIKPLEERQRFEVTLRSVVPTSQEAHEWNIDPSRIDASFLSSYSTPLIVNNGDTVAIDVLENPRTGVKLVDYFLVSDRSRDDREGHDNLEASARPIAINDLELNVFDVEIRRNGESIFKSGGGVRGRFIWFDIPDAGRFLFSLQPPAEVNGFQRLAYVTGRRIWFTYGSDRYEIVAKETIVPASGVFTLWIRYDPTFTNPPTPGFKRSSDQFSFGAADDLPLW